ncbi:RNA polymerase sigma factor [Paraburkholderia sp. Ac-20336]|uniref:RNA polymerase sigma factor n=1 Tax=Burkholderiaceae TaxID=119060 RepID=UPI001424A09D|nr:MULTISPECIES: RNA polymerase sigma factor [Burkholderiaceae]MBN3801825.1 RNA polymerase sigma factor [Paraburkholderia sp. Ac-20336]MBN3851357.1 RNA polymerase sigma factor [Paraburkholderia sp. Ac-20342]NIF56649.1 RNA polymerase sigma factor [Burkholderia sp. Ax-1724]NIF81692.1 RNA polymerase sigma factor [Paraburkholderia sp. Cy-641]
MAGVLDDLLRGYGDLRRYLSKRLSSEDAADIAQASFEVALRYVGQNEVQSPAALIFHVSRNLQIDAARRRKFLPQQLCEDETGDDALDRLGRTDVTPERECIGRQTLDQVVQALDGLPPRCREAFILCKLNGLSYEEAAHEMEISPTVIKKYLVQAMKACREAAL